MDPSIVASPADLVARVPVAIFIKSGELRLADDRLRFTVSPDEVLLDSPVAELHSVARAVTGIHVWHSDRRLRFAFGKGNERADAWVAALAPLVGRPPSGTHVRPPWPMWAWVLSLVGVLVAILAVGVGFASIVQ